MKLKIKIAIYSIVICYATNLNSQINIQWGKKIIGEQKTGVYDSFEDLKNDKLRDIGPIDAGSSTDYFQISGKYIMFKKVDFIGFKDSRGNRRRIINGKAYNVLSYGKIFLYSKGYSFSDFDKTNVAVRQAYGYDSFEIFYSFSENGELIKLKGWDKKNNDKMADLFFKDNEVVKSAYLNDNSDEYDYTVRNAFTDNLERLIHYVDLYNGLSK